MSGFFFALSFDMALRSFERAANARFVRLAFGYRRSDETIVRPANGPENGIQTPFGRNGFRPVSFAIVL